VEVTVIAPATNQSGVGDRFSTTAVTAAPAVTASGDGATSITGTPADTVLYGVQVAMPLPPHVIVSGTNLGQNLGDITTVSGTVGAARTGNRLGIPGLALSAGLGTNINASYLAAGSFAASWVSYFRNAYLDENILANTVNVNVPTCGLGTLRGILGVPLGRGSSVTGYTTTSGVVGNGTFLPSVLTRNVLTQNVDCTSTATGFTNDIDAFNNGFVPVSVMNPDLAEQ
jgi:5'-nucleotidase